MKKNKRELIDNIINQAVILETFNGNIREGYLVLNRKENKPHKSLNYLLLPFNPHNTKYLYALSHIKHIANMFNNYKLW